LENYLQAIENLRSNIQFFGSKKGFKSSDGIVVHANNLLAKAISKLEDEFRQLLLSYRYLCLCLMFIFCNVWCKNYLPTCTKSLMVVPDCDSLDKPILNDKQERLPV